LRFSKLRNNLKGVTSGEIVGLAVSFFLVAIIGPIAIGTIANMSSNATQNWDSSVLTLFQVVLPILWSAGVALKYLPGRK